MIPGRNHQPGSKIMISAKRFLLLAALAVLPVTAFAGGAYVVYESESDFDTVMDGAKAAIQERGMYINNIMHMGEMLERTGKDLGMDEKIYEHAESIEFCSAVISRKMTKEDPARIVNCPFILSVYTLPGQKGKTFIAYRAIPQAEIDGSEVMAEVSEMLKGVGQGAAAW
jgi:uncharacterized protein (DUF302 family)